MVEKRETMWAKTPAWMFWVVVIIVFALYLWTQSTISDVRTADLARQVLRAAAVEECERINDLRLQTNLRGNAVREFMLLASEVRRRAGDESAAREYESLAQEVQDIPTIDCEAEFSAWAS